MTNYCELMKEWHQKFDVPMKTAPEFPTKNRAELRYNLIKEEVKEFKKALNDGNIIEVADALGDLLYVTFGAGIEFGLPMDALFEEIHRSNMTKLWPDGKPVKRADGKILKPKTYSPPNLKKVLFNKD